MPGKAEIKIMFFYSDSNKISLETRSVINEFVWKDHQELNIKVKQINYDKEKDLCKQYGVKGTSVMLVFLNRKLVGKHYCEVTHDEVKTMLYECLGQQNPSIANWDRRQKCYAV